MACVAEKSSGSRFYCISSRDTACSRVSRGRKDEKVLHSARDLDRQPIISSVSLSITLPPYSMHCHKFINLLICMKRGMKWSIFKKSNCFVCLPLHLVKSLRFKWGMKQTKHFKKSGSAKHILLAFIGFSRPNNALRDPINTDPLTDLIDRCDVTFSFEGLPLLSIRHNNFVREMLSRDDERFGFCFRSSNCHVTWCVVTAGSGGVTAFVPSYYDFVWTFESQFLILWCGLFPFLVIAF